jgi:tRNA (cmo5U34)-methyltransferase
MTDDSTGDSIAAANAQWTFGGDVSKTFDAHVSKSVPLYNAGHELVLTISDFFVSDESVIYDMGCSTGPLTHALADRHSKKRARFIGIDTEQGMIDQANKRVGNLSNLEFHCSNIFEEELDPSDLIVAYYLVQFIKPRMRQQFFDKIYASLNWGGALLLFEKVRAPDARFQDLATTVYNDFKLAQGYTGEEIVAKTRSLKGVLEPFSTLGNLDMLARSGFVDMMTVMKWVNFEGFLAIK